MNFRLGVSCWHVVGYVNGDTYRPVLLCGKRLDERSYSGGGVEVVISQTPVCRNCDRITGGEATRSANKSYAAFVGVS